MGKYFYIFFVDFFIKSQKICPNRGFAGVIHGFIPSAPLENCQKSPGAIKKAPLKMNGARIKNY
ncbi:MAG: hypothetical protein B7Y15_02030 [Bacteroidetes bacterium 24-39-8]|nr:MAG: hypothetical protein B7Y69_02065 [Sphingobacteriia bacterium 35-40-8]OYZ52739.1 MAG: hypothetical protein B7Y15_02030 [Bacteroidetes bacterium 24-39-8]OZA68236.1 MAG: hypothetical protein B7X72_02230 [Sphingobacteriia bacterium 39-39-8]